MKRKITLQHAVPVVSPFSFEGAPRRRMVTFGVLNQFQNRWHHWTVLLFALAMCACRRHGHPLPEVVASPAATDEAPTVNYDSNWPIGEPSVRLRRNRHGNFLYKLYGLWRYQSTGEGAWVRLPLARESSPGVLLTEAKRSAPLRMFAGSLPVGTYHIVAEIDGRIESSGFFNGEEKCPDVRIGKPPSGMIAMCIANVGAKFVPDPAPLIDEVVPQRAFERLLVTLARNDGKQLAAQSVTPPKGCYALDAHSSLPIIASQWKQRPISWDLHAGNLVQGPVGPTRPSMPSVCFMRVGGDWKFAGITPGE